MDFDVENERASSVNDIRIEASSRNEVRSEVTDDEIRKLSAYFEKSRQEIQKKVDSLLALEIPIKSLKPVRSDSNLKPNESDKAGVKSTPISLELATSLREMTVGSCVHAFSNDWRRAKFLFRDENSELPYGLLTEKNGTRGLILSVQTVVIKNLIKRGYTDINGKPVINSEWRSERRILKPNETEKKDTLIKTLAEILWDAGEKKYACVVQNSGYNCFEFASTVSKKINYFGDGLTERLHLYEFTEFKGLEEFVRKNLSQFQKDDGCVLFLYSLVLSRKIDVLKEELQGSRLIGEMEDCRIPLFNLVIASYATPYLHNDKAYYNTNGESLTTPLYGLKKRSEIGILYWNSKEEDGKRTEVGSMLKTPKYPIWLCIMGKSLAIVFNTNIDLINNWRFEQCFSLHFYAGLKKQESEFKIEIETRDVPGFVGPQRALKFKFVNFNFPDEEKEPEIFSTLKTKWADCQILNDDCGKELMALL